jgi:acyl-CoA thioester hydrolase
VTVISTVQELHEKVFKMQHELVRGEDKVAVGFEVRAFASFTGEKLKAISIPGMIRSASIE